MALRDWLERTPHHEGCAAVFALSDRACTCGKRDALEELGGLEAMEELAVALAPVAD